MDHKNTQFTIAKEDLQSIKKANLESIHFNFDQEAQPIFLKNPISGVTLTSGLVTLEAKSAAQKFCQNQIFQLNIASNLKLEDPIEILLKESSKDLAFTLIINAGENSKATLIEKFENQSDQLILCNHITQLKNNTQLRIINIQNLTSESTFYEWQNSLVGTNAELKYFNFQIGGKNIFSELEQNSNAPEAKMQSDILCRGHKEQNFTLKAKHIYSQKNSKGEINARGAALDQSRIDIQGGVHITPTGSGCEGYLQQNCLLLNPKAQIKATPALKVDTNDVKAGHGAAISNLNEDSIFYMMSRGMDEATAKKLLLNSFLNEITHKISDLPHLVQEIERMI